MKHKLVEFYKEIRRDGDTAVEQADAWLSEFVEKGDTRIISVMVLPLMNDIGCSSPYVVIHYTE
jgi:hypothetical protein